MAYTFEMFKTVHCICCMVSFFHQLLLEMQNYQKACQFAFLNLPKNEKENVFIVSITLQTSWLEAQTLFANYTIKQKYISRKACNKPKTQLQVRTRNIQEFFQYQRCVMLTVAPNWCHPTKVLLMKQYYRIISLSKIYCIDVTNATLSHTASNLTKTVLLIFLIKVINLRLIISFCFGWSSDSLSTLLNAFSFARYFSP